MSEKEKDKAKRTDTPSLEAFPGEPDTVYGFLNQYGTYNIQPTNGMLNEFPMIAQNDNAQQKADKDVRKEG